MRSATLALSSSALLNRPCPCQPSYHSDADALRRQLEHRDQRYVAAPELRSAFVGWPLASELVTPDSAEMYLLPN
jgi:hypothetical protein